MKLIAFLVLLIGSINLFAQQDNTVLLEEIPVIKNNVFQQRQEINTLTKKMNNQQYLFNRQKEELKDLAAKAQDQRRKIDSLNQLIQSNRQQIVTNSTELGTKIRQSNENANSKISKLDSSLSKSQLYWIVATLMTLLLGGLIYWVLGKRIQSNRTDTETQIRNTRKVLEEETVKMDSKLIAFFEAQLQSKQAEAKSQPTSLSAKPDHSLVLKVADEVIRIQKNLSRMDKGTKGLKQLNSSVKRIQDNFVSNGYELVDMLGKEYNEGMKATVNFVQDEDFEEGKRIITRIIKPQVNYKGRMIQTAQIEVTEA